MTTQYTVTCDGCGLVFSEGDERVQVHAMEVDTGGGITSSPVLKDFHPACLPTAVTQEIGYKHGSLVGTMIPGADEPMPPRET